MSLPVYSSPHFGHSRNVTRVMTEVLVALAPAIIALWWYFGWGVIVNIIIATVAAVATEAAVLAVRGRSLKPLTDLSAVVTAVLFAVSVPQLLPWWMTVLGMIFAILVVKQLYGGLGYNPFNPAMAAFATAAALSPLSTCGITTPSAPLSSAISTLPGVNSGTRTSAGRPSARAGALLR